MVPDDQDLVLDLVKSYRTGSPRKYDEAVALLLKLAHDVPSREREVFKLISEIKSDGRQDAESIEWQQKAVAKSPNNPSAYEGLGERYARCSASPEAIAAYERTVQLDPRDSRRVRARAALHQDRHADEGDRGSIATSCATTPTKKCCAAPAIRRSRRDDRRSARLEKFCRRCRS